MKKTTISLMIAMAFGSLIAACQTAPPQSPSPAPVTPEVFTPLPPLPTVEDTSGRPAQCSVVSSGIAPAPDPNSPFPPVNDLDWQHGSEDAVISFIEYGDFQ